MGIKIEPKMREKIKELYQIELDSREQLDKLREKMNSNEAEQQRIRQSIYGKNSPVEMEKVEKSSKEAQSIAQ